jgi:protein involved in polysaccharide export with SLBB domain
MRLAVALALLACASRPPVAQPVYALVHPAVVCSAGSRISVIGQVMRPGSIDCPTGMTLRDAVLAVGGFTAIAWVNGTKLVRDSRTYRVVLDEIIEGHAPDVVLAPGDLIFVDMRD